MHLIDLGQTFKVNQDRVLKKWPILKPFSLIALMLTYSIKRFHVV